MLKFCKFVCYQCEKKNSANCSSFPQNIFDFSFHTVHHIQAGTILHLSSLIVVLPILIQQFRSCATSCTWKSSLSDYYRSDFYCFLPLVFTCSSFCPSNFLSFLISYLVLSFFFLAFILFFFSKRNNNRILLSVTINNNIDKSLFFNHI